MKSLLVILISTLSLNLFAAKPSDTFKPTNLKMIHILLTIVEEEDSTDAEIKSIRYKDVKPNTIQVNLTTYKELTAKQKEDYQAEFDLDVNYIAGLIGSDRVKVKINYAVAKK